MEAFLDTKGFANYVDASEPTVIGWRRKGEGPDYIRVGRLIRYRQSDVDRWLAERTQRHSTFNP